MVAPDPQHTFGPLTADDVAAFKLADKVIYHVTPVGGSRIRLGIESQRDGNVFTAREQKLFPKADGVQRERDINVIAQVSGYGSEFGREGLSPSGRWFWDGERDSWADAPSCFEMAHSAKYDVNLQTCIASLRVGETLRMSWMADNNNGLVRQAGLHVDQLDLIVIGRYSTTVKGSPRRSYRMSTAVCANNSARMVKRHG